MDTNTEFSRQVYSIGLVTTHVEWHIRVKVHVWYFHRKIQGSLIRASHFLDHLITKTVILLIQDILRNV